MLPAVTELSSNKLEVLLTLRNEIPQANYGANVQVRVPVPRNTGTVFCEPVGGEGCEQTAEVRYGGVFWTTFI